MAKSALTLWDTIFYGPIILGLNQYLGTLVSEKVLLFVCTVSFEHGRMLVVHEDACFFTLQAYCIVNFVCYSKQLCDVICAYLKIECFRIPVTEAQSAGAGAKRPSRTAADAKQH